MPVQRQGDGSHREEHPSDLHLGEPGLPPHEDHRQGLIDGGAGRNDRGDGLGQLDALQLTLDAKTVEAGAPVGADVDDPPILVQAQDAVGHARGAMADRGARPLDGEVARRSHPAQDFGDLLHLPLDDAPAADDPHRGLAGDDGDRRARMDDRDVLLLHCGSPGPVGFGGVLDLGGGQRLHGHGLARGRHTPADDVLKMNGGTARGPGVPGCDETPRAGAHPQDQVGCRQVRDQLPIGHQLVNPVEIGLGEVDCVSEGAGQNIRHLSRLSAVSETGSLRRLFAKHDTRSGRGKRHRRRTAGPSAGNDAMCSDPAGRGRIAA